jgi:hypothetical protein
MSVKPVTPDDVVALKGKIIPDVIIETFNEAIARNFNGGYAAIYQREIVAMLNAKNISTEEIFRNRWLDVEDIYREAGWKVDYDKPAWNESYEANFTFRKKK